VSPDYCDPGFLDWLRAYVRRHDVRAIVPSEDFLCAVRPAFPELARLLPVTPDETTLYAGLSKCDVASALCSSPAQSGITDNLPPTLLVNLDDRLPDRAELEALGTPLYIKVDLGSARAGRNSATSRVASATAARRQLADLAPHFTRALVQGYVPRRGAGVCVLRWRGELLAEFMHLRLHEVPHTGGQSSLRQSWWHQAIRDDALAKLRHLGWEGVAMMEYRWEPRSDEFRFIELTGRFWGSLHLALHAGVDFPAMLLDAFHGRPPAPVTRFPLNARSRWTFPKEVQYVRSRLGDRRLRIRSRIWSLVEFGLLFLDARVHADLLFPGDRKLYWEALRQLVWER
jgi:hypothetical protein